MLPAVSKIIAQYDITHVFSAGTAAGMGENIRIGDIICGTNYTYNGAGCQNFWL